MVSFRDVKKGDIIWLTMDPTLGHEQAGRRPALVIRSNDARLVTNMVVVCPITSTMRKTPFTCSLDDRTVTRGVILCDQVRAMDIDKREACVIETAPQSIVDECVDIVIGLITE